MDDGTLIRRLEAIEPPQVDASCERARRALPAQLRSNRVLSHPKGPLVAARVPLTALGAAVCIALAAGTLFTSPGHAVTFWIGERLGFGEAGGPPTLQELRAFATEGSAAEGQPAYVLLREPAPGIGHYELITYRAKDEPGKLWPANGARCFELNFPEARGVTGPSCGLPPARHGLSFAGAGGGGTRDGRRYFYVSGRVSDDIDAVEVEFDGRPAAVDLTPVPADLIERFRIRRPFKFFVAFFDDAQHGGPVTVTARDAAGRAIAHRRSLLLDFARMQAHVCRWVERLAEEGKTRQRNVRRSCES